MPAIVRPVLFVPGQPASLPRSVLEAQTPEAQLAAFEDFIGQLGAKPSELTSIFETSFLGDTVVSPTNALVDDLVNKGGYTLFEDDNTVNPNLFVAVQDWRMQVAPFDGVDDGILSNLTAQSIADDVFATDLNGNEGIFNYGVDYLGYWMIKAMDAWEAAGGDPSVGIDVVSHSEGYLITRSYVSSAAYGGSYTGAQSGTLPMIANWVSLAGPNEGASGIYNLLNNNFSNSLGSDPAGGLYLFEEAAYLRVTDPLLPEPIFGPDGSPLITPEDVADGTVTPEEFIQLYIASMRDEMPTYDFLDGGNVNDQPNFRNSLLLDVNAGADPNAFLDNMTVSTTAIFGTRLDTLTTATTQTGTGGTILALDEELGEVATVLEILLTGQFPPTQPGDTWIQDNFATRSGDSVVAELSTRSTFTGDPRITLLPQDRSNIDHNNTVSDPYIHGLILNILQPDLPVPTPPGAIVMASEFRSEAPDTFNSVRLTFNEDIDATSFTTDDVTITGPGGTIAASAVTLVAGTKDQFDVAFPTQSALGEYTFTLGTDILNALGQPMDQNNNDINGEPGIAPTGDQFSTSIEITVQPTAIFAVGAPNGSVRILNGNGGAVLVSNFRPLDVAGGSQYKGLVSVAFGDLNGDGVADVYVAAANPVGVQGLAPSKAGKVFVYDGATLLAGTIPTAAIHVFTPFATTDGPNGKVGAYVNGLNIATGDIDGDGAVELIAGTRGNTATAGNVEYGRLIVIVAGTDADGSDDSTIGSIITPFGPSYQKGVIVAAGNMDGFGGDEIAVTRGGPVASANPNKSIKLKAYQFDGSDLLELDLNGAATGAFAPFPTLERDARLAFVDENGDGSQELVFSALDRTDPVNAQVRIAVFSINTIIGVATAVSTGTGPSNSYVVGTNIVDHAITHVDLNGDGSSDLALLTQTASSGMQYLDSFTGALLPGGFNLSILNGGVTLAGI